MHDQARFHEGWQAWFRPMSIHSILVRALIEPSSEPMPAPAKVDPTPPLPGLSPAAGRPIVARFDGGRLSSDGGLLALREIERRLGLAERLAACTDDTRAAGRVQHRVADILRFRLLMIAAGYEDGNDADALRHDQVFKLALGCLPDDAELCSQPTISRLENLPGIRDLLRMARAMVGLGPVTAGVVHSWRRRWADTGCCV